MGLRRYLVPLTAGLLVLGAMVGLVAATVANMEDGARGQRLLEAGLRAQALLSRLRDAETGQRGYLLTGRESYLEPFRLVRDGVGPEADGLLAATATEPALAAQAARAADLAREKLGELDRTVALYRAGDAEAAMALVLSDTGKRLMDGTRDAVAALEGLVRAEFAAIERGRTRRFLWLAGGALPAILLAALLLLLRARRARQGEARAEARARAADAEIAGIYATAPVGLGLVDRDLRFVSINPHLADINGLPVAAHLGRPMAEVLPPGLSAMLEPLHQRVLASGESFTGLKVSAEIGVAPGRERHFEVSCHPVRAPDGAGVTGVSTTVLEVTERVEAERRRDLVTRELNHRVKNILTVVQAIVAQTLRGSDDPAAFARKLGARLTALSRAHELLTAVAWDEVALDAVVRAALAPWMAEDGRIELGLGAGAATQVSPGQAQSLVLALHELATNAAKYGALSVPGGRLALDCEVGATGRVVLHWHERGGPAVAGPPARRGFGTRMLERALARDLGNGAEVVLHFEPEGLRARLGFVPEGGMAARAVPLEGVPA